MTGAAIEATTPAGTPVWVDTGHGIALPGRTLNAPYSIGLGVVVYCEVYNRRDGTYELSRVTRRRSK